MNPYKQKRNALCRCGSGIKAKRCCGRPAPPKPAGWTLTLGPTADPDDQDYMDLSELRAWALGTADKDGESWIFAPTDTEGRWFWFLEGRDARRFAEEHYAGSPYIVIPIADLSVFPDLRAEPLVYGERPPTLKVRLVKRKARLCL